MRNGADHVTRVSGEIESLRGELGSLVAELDRRRKEAFDLRLQAQRHPLAMAVVAGLAAMAVGGYIASRIRSARRHRRPSVRAREAQRALARLLEHPDRVANEPSLLTKLATAAAIAAGTALARSAAERYIAPRPGVRRVSPQEAVVVTRR